MNVTFLITLLTVAGLFSTVIADCDPLKCVSFLEAIDKSDPQQLCPALKTVTFCLEDLFATCPTLEPDSRTTLENALAGITEKINNACVEVFPPPVEINTMSVTTTKTIPNDIQSDDTVGAVGEVFPPTVEINTMSVTTTKTIPNDIQSDDTVGAVGGALGVLLVISIIIIIVLIFKRTKSDDGTKSSKVQPVAWRPDRNSKPMFVHY